MINLIAFILTHIANFFLALFFRIRNLFKQQLRPLQQEEPQHHSLRWKQVEYNNKQTKPCARWGQSCVVIQGGLLVFGGFCQFYFNDLWYFCPFQLAWISISTDDQKKPCPRSCSSLHYQSTQCKVILFGGGHRKDYYNDVYFMSWSDHNNWEKLQYQQGDARPVERTYHSSDLFEKYLFLFGGEGPTCLDDLWALDLQTNKWRELITKNKIPPRKFHSSIISSKILYIVGGIDSDNKVLATIYSINLLQYIQESSMDSLEWVLVCSGSEHIQRWGHCCIQFEQNILILGGRNNKYSLSICNTVSHHIKGVKVQGEQDFRKACIGRIGSCLISFGGFKGNHYNDSFKYLNLSPIKHKKTTQIQDILHVPSILNGSFAEEIDSLTNMIYFMKKARIGSLIYLSNQQYQRYLSLIEESNISYMQLIVNQSFKARIIIGNAVHRSLYFKNLLKQGIASKQIFINVSQPIDQQALKVIVNYVNTDCLILSSHFNTQTLINIHSLSCFFVLESLSSMIEGQLIKKITDSTCIQLLKHSSIHNSILLLQSCFSFVLYHPQLEAANFDLPLFQTERLERVKEDLIFQMAQQRIRNDFK